MVVVVPPENQQGHNPAMGLLHQAKEQSCGGVSVVSSSVKSSISGGLEDGGKGATGRFKLTSEELDYYLYGQQRMEIIPLSNHTGEVNNRTYTHTHTATRTLLHRLVTATGVHLEGVLPRFLRLESGEVTGKERKIRMTRTPAVEPGYFSHLYQQAAQMLHLCLHIPHYYNIILAH